MTTVTFLSRVGCHLCAEAHLEVLAARAVEPFDLIELDVDADPELRAEYGEQVPVVLIDDQLFSYFETDRAGLIRAVADARRRS